MGLEAILAGILAAVAGVLIAFLRGSMKGRQQQKDKANADTLDRMEKGRRAVDRDGTPDQRLRDNDSRW